MGKRIGQCRHRVILLAVLLVASIIPTSLLTVHASATSGKYFDHVVTILMENNDLPSVLAQGSYQAGLANQYTLAKGYSAVSHPSEPNYSVMISGQIGVNKDDGLCCGQDNSQNLVDNLESHGLTWKAFAEDLTTGDCTGAESILIIFHSYTSRTLLVVRQGATILSARPLQAIRN